MADWLTHVLVAYVVLQVVAWRVSWLTPPFIVAGMAGGLIPDLAKIGIVLPNHVMASITGLPFYWKGLSSTPASVLSAMILATVVDRTYRLRVFGLFLFGLYIHHILDGMIIIPGPSRRVSVTPLGLIYLPELYLSTHRWPTVLAVVSAVVVFSITTFRSSELAQNE